MSNRECNRGLEKLELALRSLRPVPSRVDRDGLLFRAGQRSARRGRGFWRAAAIGMAAMAATLGTTLLVRPEEPPIERIVYVEAERPVREGLVRLAAGRSPERDRLLGAAADYAELRQKVLSEGLQALPIPKPSRAGPYPDAVDELLGEPGAMRHRREQLFPLYFPSSSGEES